MYPQAANRAMCLSNIGKTVFIEKRKTYALELGISMGKQMPSNKSLSYTNFFSFITYDTLYFNCLIQPEGIKILLLHRKREYPF